MTEKQTQGILQPMRNIPPNSQTQERKSSYENYSAICLPSLREDKTTALSAQVSLSRNSTQKWSGSTINDLRETKLMRPDGTTELTHASNTVIGESAPKLYISNLVNSCCFQTRLTNRYPELILVLWWP